MASRIRQLASETAVYGVASILGRLINFALVPFYTNVLPVDHYGVVILVYTALVFLQIVFTYGMESAYLRFAAGAEGRANVQVTFSSAIWSLAGSSIVLCLLLLVFRTQTAWVIGIQPDWFDLIYFAAAILVFDALAVVPMAELRLSNRPWRFASVRLLNVAVNVSLNLYLILGLGMGVRAIFVANLVASASVLLVLTPEFVRYLRLRLNSNLWRSLVRFGLPFVPGGLAYALSERVSLFFLGRMTTDQVLALYGDQIDSNLISSASQAAGQAGSVYGQYIVSVFGTAYKLAIFMMLISQMFRYAWQPFFLNRANDPDAKDLFARVLTLFTAGAGFVVLCVSFFAFELVSLPLPGGRFLIPEAYWLGLQIVPLALLGYAFQGWYYNFSVGIYLEKQTKYFVHATVVGGTASVVLTALLVPVMGMMGAAIATTTAFASTAMTLLFYSQRAYFIPYRWDLVAVIISAAGACFGFWYFIEALHVWWAEILLIMTYTIVLYACGIAKTRLKSTGN
ncbi:lipopolysaccharide biosynthesis protein [Bacteroidota bacterium]